MYARHDSARPLELVDDARRADRAVGAVAVDPERRAAGERQVVRKRGVGDRIHPGRECVAPGQRVDVRRRAGSDDARRTPRSPSGSPRCGRARRSPDAPWGRGGAGSARRAGTGKHVARAAGGERDQGAHRRNLRNSWAQHADRARHGSGFCRLRAWVAVIYGRLLSSRSWVQRPRRGRAVCADAVPRRGERRRGRRARARPLAGARGVIRG